MLIVEFIVPKAQKTGRTKFWRAISSDERVTELLNQNREQIETAFKYYTHDRKPRVTIEECSSLVHQCQLDISDHHINICFAESQLMPSSDTSERNKERLKQLSYQEFVYFLCRVTEAHYQETMYADEQYWIKLDHMILFLLDPFEVRPNFRYNAKFVYDQQQYQQKH